MPKRAQNTRNSSRNTAQNGSKTRANVPQVIRDSDWWSVDGSKFTYASSLLRMLCASSSLSFLDNPSTIISPQNRCRICNNRVIVGSRDALPHHNHHVGQLKSGPPFAIPKRGAHKTSNSGSNTAQDGAETADQILKESSWWSVNGCKCTYVHSLRILCASSPLISNFDELSTKQLYNLQPGICGVKGCATPS